MRILVINPGSTSTKLSIFEDGKEIVREKISHSKEELSRFERISDQFDFRKKIIEEFLKKHGFSIQDFDAIGARGGNTHPLESGVYRVNKKMTEDLLSLKYGAHASNLGGPLALSLAEEANIPAFIVDPVIVDEMQPVAKITGLKGIKRKAKDHPLNQKAAARIVAEELGTTYEKANFIVAHLGGGISVASHKKGRMIDENNALNGDGPFSPERSGDLPNISLVELCFSGKYTKEEIKKMLAGKGGLVSHLGTNSLLETLNMIKSGDEYAKLVFDAMVYQIAKEIGKHAAVLKGDVDAIVLTGGLARSKELTESVRDYVSFIAPVFVVPGEHEMEAIERGVRLALLGKEKIKEYE
ncbi:MAG: butyrate kinase [Caldisericaceae bacterium]|nr:butyrate kinase [Caldisericaceae bacterium]